VQLYLKVSSMLEMNSIQSISFGMLKRTVLAGVLLIWNRVDVQ